MSGFRGGKIPPSVFEPDEQLANRHSRMAAEIQKRLRMAEENLMAQIQVAAAVGYEPVPGSLKLEQNLDDGDNTISYRYTIQMRRRR